MMENQPAARPSGRPRQRPVRPAESRHTTAGPADARQRTVERGPVGRSPARPASQQRHKGVKATAPPAAPPIQRKHPSRPAAKRPARRPSRITAWIESAIDNFSVAKPFTLFGFAVAAGLLLVFGADLITGQPFWRASRAIDIAGVVCGALLAYLSWDTLRELDRR